MPNDQQNKFKEFTDRFTVKNAFDLKWESMFIQSKQHFKKHQSFTVKKNAHQLQIECLDSR